MVDLKSGNQMIAAGAIRSGCRFFAGYPITPASGIYSSMTEFLQRRGDVAVSAPDEISALAYCVGASLRGYKAMTATSGPGWALMIETVQYAVMTETPVVIALVQRLGPSTGGATQGAQGDVLLAEFCTSGGYTIPILCPSNAQECYELTIRAFSWAEQLRTPVVLLTDKEVAMTSETVDLSLCEEPTIINRPLVSPEARMTHTYDFDDPGDIPAFAGIGGSIRVTATGSAHNKSGSLRKNDPETLLVLRHLEEKIETRRDELSIVKYDVVVGAKKLVISYGITSRAAAEAVVQARLAEKSVNLLCIHSLFPIPDRVLQEATKTMQRIIVAEENLKGQYRSLIAPYLGDAEVVGVNRIGQMITPGEILNAIG
jgi:2-oxoglutarate ferredoxin oxidoreductase subunit alpha